MKCLTEVIFPNAPSKFTDPNWVILFFIIALLIDALTRQSKFKFVLLPSLVILLYIYVFLTTIINSSSALKMYT